MQWEDVIENKQSQTRRIDHRRCPFPRGKGLRPFPHLYPPAARPTDTLHGFGSLLPAPCAHSHASNARTQRLAVVQRRPQARKKRPTANPDRLFSPRAPPGTATQPPHVLRRTLNSAPAGLLSRNLPLHIDHAAAIKIFGSATLLTQPPSRSPSPTYSVVWRYSTPTIMSSLPLWRRSALAAQTTPSPSHHHRYQSIEDFHHFSYPQAVLELYSGVLKLLSSSPSPIPLFTPIRHYSTYGCFGMKQDDARLSHLPPFASTFPPPLWLYRLSGRHHVPQLPRGVGQSALDSSSSVYPSSASCFFLFPDYKVPFLRAFFSQIAPPFSYTCARVPAAILLRKVSSDLNLQFSESSTHIPNAVHAQQLREARYTIHCSPPPAVYSAWISKLAAKAVSLLTVYLAALWCSDSVTRVKLPFDVYAAYFGAVRAVAIEGRQTRGEIDEKSPPNEGFPRPTGYLVLVIFGLAAAKYSPTHQNPTKSSASGLNMFPTCKTTSWHPRMYVGQSKLVIRRPMRMIGSAHEETESKERNQHSTATASFRTGLSTWTVPVPSSPNRSSLVKLAWPPKKKN
ncbi:hypothetical protein B0H19DRAFT_1244410 [Mycena capillaripes]|nr:hypothetical protein B0H19DRAFT_1244410 [Mycena capillaripes]